MNMRSIFHAAIMPISCVLALPLVGCTHLNVYEIDTTPAENFTWSGRVRITERHIDEYALFAPPKHRTEIVRIELLGDQDRNLVIRPADFAGEDPNMAGASARMQECGVPPDIYLVRMREENPEFERAWRSMRAYESLMQAPEIARDRSESEAARTKEEARAICDAFQQDFQIAAERFNQIQEQVDRQQYDHITGLELAFVAAFKAKQIEATYDLNDSQIARVRIDDRNLLTVTVEDRDGHLVHCYCPQELKLIEDPAR